MIWFTSDRHYNHKNIVRGCSEWKTFEEGSSHQNTRDFDTLEEHNEALIKAINKYVKHDDVLYDLGDMSFRGIDSIWECRKQINCQTIHYILGNHCHHIEANKVITMPKADFEQYEYLLAYDVIGQTAYVKLHDLFESVQHYKEVSINGKKVILSHYAHRVWNKSHHGAYHLYGHSHDTLDNTGKFHGKSMDVGVDSAFRLFGEYRPFSWTEIDQILRKRDTLIIDHHNSNTN